MKQTKHLVVYILVFVFFVILSFATAAKGEDNQTLEQRVYDLENKVNYLQSEAQQFVILRMRYESWNWGGYSAILYSTRERHVVFESDTSFVTNSWSKEYTCWPCRIGDYKHISLYDENGNFLDSVEFASKLQKGDLVVGWYTTEKPETLSGKPHSVPSGTTAFYWNPKTGLAVGILRINETMVN